MSRVLLALLLLCALALTANAAHVHKRRDHLAAAVRKVAGADNLKDAAALTGRYFGSCLAQSELTNKKLISALLADWNAITPENEMKWDATEPQNNTWNWGAADAIFNWGQNHSFLVRGHTLVWHSQVPSWVSNLKDETSLLQAMYNHMEVIMARYKGKIYAWDVVNEAFADDGTENLRPASLSVWTRVFGNSTRFIELAFRHARLQDANAKLCYNDYSTDGINPKSTGVYKMVKDFKARGVPIDCVGFQGHLNGHPTADFQANLQRFADLGVEVYMTELDIQENTSGGADKQADAYAAVVQACLNVPACKGISTWGVDDANSWKSSTTPLLLDANFDKKPAYTAVLDAFTGVVADAPAPCIARALVKSVKPRHHLKIEVTAAPGHAIKRAALLLPNGRALSMKRQHAEFSLDAAAMKQVPQAARLQLQVTSASGAVSTLELRTLQAGERLFC